MRGYRAVIIDAKKFTGYGLKIAIIIVVSIIMFFNIKISGKIEKFKFGHNAEKVLSDSIPTILPALGEGDGDASGIVTRLSKIASFFMTFDPGDMKTVIFGEIPLIKTVSKGHLARMANESYVLAYNPQNADLGEGNAEPISDEEGEFPIKEVDQGKQKLFGIGKKSIAIRNETNYGINIEEMIREPLLFNIDSGSPQILILHTHATESYTAEGVNMYSTDKSDRSLSTRENVVRVGEAIAEVFRERGINVIHDTTLHDHPNFNGSYSNSLKTIEKYKARYPDLCMVIDVHRDAYIYDDGSKAKFVSEINGKKVAQLMFVVGTDSGGLKHPNWRENMKLAVKLQNRISKKYPTLMRGINLRKERFNGHTTNGSLIVEVGSSGNTLSEAIAGATYATEEIADFLKESS